MNKVIALIPAKKNSKRLSNKNLRKFKGKSLISVFDQESNLKYSDAQPLSRFEKPKSIVKTRICNLLSYKIIKDLAIVFF